MRVNVPTDFLRFLRRNFSYVGFVIALCAVMFLLEVKRKLKLISDLKGGQG